MNRPWLWCLVCLLAISYLSLYPGQFASAPSTEGLSWSMDGSSLRRQVLDIVNNLLLYIPLGIAAGAAFGRGVPRSLASVGACALVSLGIEYLQLWLPTRHSSFRDLLTNTAGAALGVALLRTLDFENSAYFRGVLRGRHWACSATGAAMGALWVFAHCLPLVPKFDLVNLSRQMRALIDPDQIALLFQPADALRIAMQFAAVATVLNWNRWAWVAGLVIPAQVLLPDHTLSWSLIVGILAGWWLSWLWEAVPLRWVAPVLYCVWLFYEQFRPFSMAADPVRFGWLPFLSLIDVATAGAYQILFGKWLLYAAVVWALRRAGQRWPVSVSIPLALVACGEWTQRWLVGRTPESTDIALVLGGAMVVYLGESVTGSTPVAGPTSTPYLRSSR